MPKMRCSICHGSCEPWYPGSDGYGHNAEPINHGRCCSACNDMVVIPERIKRMYAHENMRGVRKDHEPQE